MATLAKLTWQSPQRRCSTHKQQQRELEEVAGYFLSTFLLPSLPIYISILKYASSTQASLTFISFHIPCAITAPSTHMTTLGTAHKHQNSRALPPILIYFNYQRVLSQQSPRQLPYIFVLIQCAMTAKPTASARLCTGILPTSQRHEARALPRTQACKQPQPVRRAVPQGN